MRNYRYERLFLYDTAEEVKEVHLTGEFPGSSVIDSLLWNILYIGALWLPLPRGASIVGCADGMATMIQDTYCRQTQYNM